MKKLKAILVDDEKNALEVLEWLIANYCPDVEIIGIYQSGELVLEALKSLEPDVIFLDVEMPKMNGLELIEKLTTRNFELVFTTAYDQFAIKAFKYAALDYLLKPIDPDELMETIRRLKQNKTAIHKDQLEMIMEHYAKQNSAPDRIALNVNDSIVFISKSEIMYCKAESNYTTVVLENRNKILVSKTLKDISETLEGNDFFRVHKSYLVNVHHISKFMRNDGGYLIMADGQEISIARDRKDDFFNLFSRI